MKNWHVRGDSKALLFIPLLLIFHYYVEGYTFGVNDQVTQIPILNYLRNPNLYSGDLLVQIIPFQFTYFYKLIGTLLPSEKSIESLYLLGYFITYGSALYFFIRLCEIVTRSKIAAQLAAVILASGYYPTLAGGYFEPFFSHRALAFPLIVASLYYYLRKKYLLSLILAGVTWNIHGLHAFHLTFILLYSIGFLWKRIDWKRVLLSVGMLILISSPVVFWRFTSYLQQSHSDIESWLSVVTMGSELHIFPLSWGWIPYIRMGTFLVYLYMGMTFLKNRLWQIPVQDQVKPVFASIFILCLNGLIFIEFILSRIAIEAQFFRSTVFLYLFGLPLVSLYLVEKFQKGDTWSKIMASLSVAAFISHEVEFIILPLLYFIPEDLFPGTIKSKMKKGAISFFIFSASILFGLNGLGILNMSIIRLNLLRETTLVFFVIFLGVTSIFLFSRKKIIAQGFEPLLLGVVGLGIIAGFLFSFFTGISKTTLQEPDWREIQEWSKGSTQKNTLFLTPVYLNGFRVFSERGVVVEWYDGTWTIVDSEFSRLWWERMKDFGINEENYQERKYVYNALREKDFYRIGKKYGAQYVITEKPKSLQFERIFENNTYTIFALP
jgi:hypothetical protein